VVASRLAWRLANCRGLHDDVSSAVFDCPASAQETAGVAVAHLSRDIGVDSVMSPGPFAERSFRRTEAIASSSRDPDRRTALGFVVSSAVSIRSALRSASDLRTARRS
jgi:hypothetical protein